MTDMTLTPLLEQYFKAADNHDWDTLVSCFLERGLVVDESHAYVGPSEIRRWREQTASQWTYTSELTHAEPVGQTGHHVVTHLEGNFPGGVVDLHYQFTIADGLICSLTIAP